MRSQTKTVNSYVTAVYKIVTNIATFIDIVLLILVLYSVRSYWSQTILLAIL